MSDPQPEVLPRRATSVRPVDDDDRFGAGMACGFGLAAIVIHIALTSLVNWSDMYADFGHNKLPLLTRLTISWAWRFGVPIVGGVALGLLIIWRPKRLRLYVLVAIALAAAAFMTWWFPSAPIYELAGNIK